MQILVASMVGVRLAPMADDAQVSNSAESIMARTATTPAEGVKAISRQDLKDKIDWRESFVLLETLSSDAARVMTCLGYTRVRHYAGGKQNWTTAGLSVERGHEHAARA